MIKPLRYIGLNMKNYVQKVEKEAEALDYLPYPGEIGKRFRKIFQRVGSYGKSTNYANQ